MLVSIRPTKRWGLRVPIRIVGAITPCLDIVVLRVLSFDFKRQRDHELRRNNLLLYIFHRHLTPANAAEERDLGNIGTVRLFAAAAFMISRGAFAIFPSTCDICTLWLIFTTVSRTRILFTSAYSSIRTRHAS